MLYLSDFSCNGYPHVPSVNTVCVRLVWRNDVQLQTGNDKHLGSMWHTRTPELQTFSFIRVHTHSTTLFFYRGTVCSGRGVSAQQRDVLLHPSLVDCPPVAVPYAPSSVHTHPHCSGSTDRHTAAMTGEAHSVMLPCLGRRMPACRAQASLLCIVLRRALPLLTGAQAPIFVIINLVSSWRCPVLRR